MCRLLELFLWIKKPFANYAHLKLYYFLIVNSFLTCACYLNCFSELKNTLPFKIVLLFNSKLFFPPDIYRLPRVSDKSRHVLQTCGVIFYVMHKTISLCFICTWLLQIIFLSVNVIKIIPNLFSSIQFWSQLGINALM